MLERRRYAIWGSAGFLEIAVNGGSAAELLRGKRGYRVTLDSPNSFTS